MKKILRSFALFLGLLMLPTVAHAQNAYGDVNNDGEVNVADVNAVIDVILGSGSSSSADVNGDGEINIADVNTVIDIILNGSYEQIYSTMLVTTTDGTTAEYLIDKNTRMRIEKPNLVIETVGKTLTWNLERLARLSFGTQHLPYSHAAMTHDEVMPQTQQESSPDDDSTSRYALLHYGKGGLMNAILNIDVDSITYTNADLSGRLHPNVVVQQVWTPDSLYSIPLIDIDSIGFQAPETKFKDDVFHIQERHLPYVLAVDELSIFFSNTIPGTMLPQIGQVVVSDIYEGPLVGGFAGRVEQINNDNGKIEIKCSQVAITDIFAKLFLIGKGVSGQTGSGNAPRRASSDPWASYEDQGLHSIDLPDELKLEIFDGVFEVTSKEPTLTVSYFIYIDEMIYSFAADAYMNHSDLSFTLAFKLSDFLEVAQSGSEFFTNLILGKGDQEEAEEKFYEHDFDDIKLSIPFHWGPVNFALEIAPIFKLEGDVELDLITKTKAIQHIGFNKQGLTPALLANPIMSMAIGDYKYGYTQDPLAFHQLKAKMNGSASMGILLQLKANVITEKLLHAAVGAEYDRKASTTLEFNLYDEENQPSNFYDVIKDSKVEVKDLLKIKGEIGVSPLEILTLKGAYPITIKEWGSYNIVPHFTKPELPAYADGSWTYPSLLTGCDPLSLYSTVSKDVLLKCYPGLSIVGTDGVTVKQYTSSEPYQYEDAWKYIPLELDISDLSPGNTYRCYPTFSMLGLNPFKAAPYHEFVVPEPMTLETQSVTIRPGGTRDVKIIGGWGEYSVFNLDPDKFTAELKKDGDSSFVHVIGKSLGASTVTVRDLRANVIKVFLVEVTDNDLLEQISVEPSQIDFGVVEYGTDKTSSLTVTNAGNSTVTITVNSDPSFTDYFEVSSNNETRTLAPGASMNYIVTAHGSQTGCHAVTNLLVSSAGGEQQLVALSARGMDNEPLLDVSSVSLNPGEQTVVMARSGNCTVTNSNESVVHVRQSGGSSGGGGWPPYCSNASYGTSKYTVEALSNGTATVVITDEYSGQEGILTITVGEGGTDNHELSFIAPNEAIDLGLPSGILWAPYNLGASRPEEFGGYYAWGEIEVKDVYDSENYLYKDENGYIDIGRNICGTDYDAAHVKWGGDWRMPTMEELNELWNHCTYSWTAVNGINGMLLTAPNGNSVFLPAASCNWSDDNCWGFYRAGTCPSGYNNPLIPAVPDILQFTTYGLDDLGSYGSLYGLSIRPVREKPGTPIIAVNPTSINFGQVPVGQTRTEHFTVSNVGDGILTFSVSSTHGMFDIPESGQEFSLQPGGEKVFDVTFTPESATTGGGPAVRVFSNAENGTQYIEIDGQGGPPSDDHGGEWVDLGLPSGTLWATCNVGASSPEDYGDYFAWGETAPKDNYNWSTYKWSNGSNTTMTKYCTNSSYGYNGFTDGKTELDPEDDAAHVNWGPSWRMPTTEQQRELYENCSSVWTTQNGVNGRLFTGPNGNTLFLPAAGYRWYESLFHAGSGGDYWSRTLRSSYPINAYDLGFNSGNVRWSSDYRGIGVAVRAVRVSQN